MLYSQPRRGHDDSYAHTGRRTLLQFALGAACSACLPISVLAGEQPTLPALAGNRRVILVNLFGGNDNFNTLIPYKDPLYKAYRPDLAVADKEQIRLTDELALNASLTGLHDSFQAGQMAIVQEVGNPARELSHFESASIWSAGALSGTPEMATREGWVGRVFAHDPAVLHNARLDAHGVDVYGAAADLKGEGVKALAVSDITAFLAAQSGGREHIEPTSPSHAMRYVARIMNDSMDISQTIRTKLTGENPFTPRFMRRGVYLEPEGRQASLVLWMIERGVQAPFYRIQINGYDMHSDLAGNHPRMLALCDEIVTKLRDALRDMGAWDDTLIVVQTEFGRRPTQNASLGTDHGSAAPVFLLGGKVAGGLIGSRARLDDLDPDGNVKYHVDFRSLYSTIVNNFWQTKSNPYADAGFQPLDIKLT